MRLDTIIRMLMPHEERFRTLLARDTANLLRAAQVFAALARSQSLEERRVKLVELKSIEHEGDDITRLVFEALNKSFITPLDREDIRSLAKDLDDILDYLEMVGQNLVLFELAEAPEALTQFADILVKMVAQIEKLTAFIWDLTNEKAIQAGIVHISDLENQADQLYYTVIADLFKRDKDQAVLILKWKEIYDGLENACDECKEYTHVVGNVVIKNA
jgi:predicted phosphate transport protein (TIGR00153 family)